MLLIAIPKSASTSLMDTLGRLHKLPATQTSYRNKHYPVPRELSPLLTDYHSDLREFAVEDIEQFTAPDAFHKQHVPPTRHNLELLRTKKKVVLLRNPEDIIEAYARATRVGIAKPIGGLSRASSAKKRKALADTLGITADLYFFYDGWVRERQEKPAYTHIVFYGDLMQNPKRVVNMVEAFFGLPLSPSVKLSKKRYSRYPTVRYGWQRVTKRVSRLSKRVMKKCLNWT